VGQNIDITVATYPGRKFTGQVYFVAPFVEAATRTALVKAKIPNPKLELRPGMFANLELTVKLKDQAIVIPESAVLASGDRTIVFVVGADDVAQIQPVNLGARLAGLVEVTGGLHGGERVVSEGLQKVRPGGRVKPVDGGKVGAQTANAGESGKGRESEKGRE
jgi:membrane fusion protein (multidrug efflux system)